MKNYFFIFFAALTILGCQQESKKQKATRPVSSKSDTTIIGSVSGMDTLRLFEGIRLVGKSNGDTVAFISLSDVDTLGVEHETQLMPNPGDLTPENSRYISLEGAYRNRLLKGTRISEEDSLFIYNYSRDLLHAFPVSLLRTGAMLNIYRDDSDAPHEVDDYMYGLEIDSTQLTTLKDEDFYNSVIFIGAENPFVRGSLQPIIWKRIDLKRFPSTPVRPENRVMLKGYSLKDCYEFKKGYLHYYLQEYTIKEDFQIARVVVVDLNLNKIVLNDVFGYEEGSDFTGIVQHKLDSPDYEQYTGYLIKNRPPVIFGLEYASFGSRSAIYLDGSHSHITFNSDNRH